MHEARSIGEQLEITDQFIEVNSGRSLDVCQSQRFNTLAAAREILVGTQAVRNRKLPAMVRGDRGFAVALDTLKCMEHL
jgi:hypothetical protein